MVSGGVRQGHGVKYGVKGCHMVSGGVRRGQGVSDGAMVCQMVSYTH